MQSTVNLYPLIGVVLILAGLCLRFHPMLVVVVGAVGTGLGAA
ncbi:DUF969 domain-containing protein, partial [Burkholderia gladioli]|nr:DUF969 domain-containing protein [Burkholderia gladioli]